MNEEAQNDASSGDRCSPEEAEMPPMLIIPEEKETGREDNKSET